MTKIIKLKSVIKQLVSISEEIKLNNQETVDNYRKKRDQMLKGGGEERVKGEKG
ncbi:unnamed protein product [marine sediment metagenome]|uniref:Uncharacterized protein n=1 Tax=marine sediment metagenome TaxID=412755 RepID=X1IJ97_9ZZZZ